MVHSKHDTLCTSDEGGGLPTALQPKGDVSTVDSHGRGQHILPRTEIQVHTVMRRRDGVPRSHLLETILKCEESTLPVTIDNIGMAILSML